MKNYNLIDVRLDRDDGEARGKRKKVYPTCHPRVKRCTLQRRCASDLPSWNTQIPKFKYKNTKKEIQRRRMKKMEEKQRRREYRIDARGGLCEGGRQRDGNHNCS